MAVSPVDKGDQFEKSGQRLITDPRADRLLALAAKQKAEREAQEKA